MNDDHLEQLLESLANGTRRRIFERLCTGPASVNEIATSVPVSRPAVSQHLKALKEAGLVRERRLGRQVIYQARPERLSVLDGYIQQLTSTATPTPQVQERDAVDDAIETWGQRGLEYDPASVAMIVRLIIVADSMERMYEQTSRHHGLAKGDTNILGTLRRSANPGGLTPSEIAEAALISRPDISRRLIRLEASGMIARQQASHDQRSHNVRLTALGETTIDAITREQFGGCYRPVFTLSREQRSSFDQVLRQLLVQLNTDQRANSSMIYSN